MDHVLVFGLSRKVFDLLLDGSPRFTRDSERGATRYRRLVVSRVVTVGCRQVDGEATVIAEALEAVSRINLARINVQLPTPHLSPIFKHRLPIRPWVSIFDPNDHHPNSL